MATHGHSTSEKIKDHWPAFVAYKKSDKGKQRSVTNKLNAAKKKYHHVTGSGGYSKARPTWDKAEQDIALARSVKDLVLRGWGNFGPRHRGVCLDESSTCNTRQEA